MALYFHMDSSKEVISSLFNVKKKRKKKPSTPKNKALGLKEAHLSLGAWLKGNTVQNSLESKEVLKLI